MNWAQRFKRMLAIAIGMPKPFRVAPRTLVIGADISGIDLNQVDPSGFPELQDALTEHLVLFFRDEDIPVKARMARPATTESIPRSRGMTGIAFFHARSIPWCARTRLAGPVALLVWCHELWWYDCSCRTECWMRFTAWTESRYEHYSYTVESA